MTRPTRAIVEWMPDTRRPEASDREPSRMHVALGILGLIVAAASLLGLVT